MNNQPEQYPRICQEVGLTCKRCTEDTATSLAAVCKGLRAKAVTQLFHQIYPQPACASMSSHFGRAYRAASQVEVRLPERLPARKEVTKIRPLPLAAVA
jgi:hypothetical protein